MQHDMKLQSKYFDLIKSGKKIYEVRLYDKKRRAIRIGDEIVFSREPLRDETIKVEVDDILLFESIELLTQSLSLEKLGFADKSAQEVSKIYLQFYDKDLIKEDGLVAIKMKLK